TGRLDVVKGLGTVRFEDIDLEVSRNAHETYSFTGSDVHSVRGETLWDIGFARGDWSTHATTRTVLTSTATDFHVYAELDAWEGAGALEELEHHDTARSPVRGRLSARAGDLRSARGSGSPRGRTERRRWWRRTPPRQPAPARRGRGSWCAATPSRPPGR